MKYESEAMQVIHEDMKGMHQLGIINDARMKEFDDICFVHEDEPAYRAEEESAAMQHATA